MRDQEFQPFEMERWQSTYENVVEFNLSESGVHPLTLGELLEIAGDDALPVPLGYGQSNGSGRLRQNIARLYRNAGPENVCVTNGSAEANFIALWSLVGPGSEIAVLAPTYMQSLGLARSAGASVRKIPLHEENGWQPDPDEVLRIASQGVDLIVVTNPGNPTGAVLSSEARKAIVEAADRSGAWLLADEVYSGAELDGPETPSFWGEYPRVIATGSLSKAYGLPGLRIGWLVAPETEAERLWARKDYTTISPGDLTDHLARMALEPGVRPRILDRTRRAIRRGWQITHDWMVEQGCFTCRPPDAGAICYARYDLPIASGELAERLRVEKSVLIVSGEHFEMERYVRIGFGITEPMLRAALDRFGEVLSELMAGRMA